MILKYIDSLEYESIPDYDYIYYCLQHAEKVTFIKKKKQRIIILNLNNAQQLLILILYHHALIDSLSFLIAILFSIHSLNRPRHQFHFVMFTFSQSLV